MFRKILYNCSNAQKLIIKSEERPLNILETIRLKIHLHYCRICREFVQFSAFLNKQLLNLGLDIYNHPKHRLTEEDKQRLQELIDRHKE